MPRHSKRLPHNRRRKGFQLLGPRHMASALMGAIVAAAILHYGGFKILPWLFPEGFWNAPARETPPEVPEERTLVRFQEEKTQPELADDPSVAEPTEAEMPEEPQEIDPVDMPFEELTIAPGETNLALPSPEPAPDAALQAPMTPELHLPSLADSAPPVETAVPEVAPVNANPLTVKAAALPADMDPEKWLKDAIDKGARTGDAPGDTRSLGELIQLANPGARDGAARLGADLIFAFNRAELKSSARISLLQLAALIHKNPNTRFIIEGHTDSIGSEPYNALLSLQRAQAVREWLKENGIPMKNVYIRACGSRSPLVSTRGDREAQSANRRVEIHMRKQTEALPEGCLDAAYRVDMKTPIAEQLRRNTRLPGSHPSILQPSAARPADAPRPQRGSAPRTPAAPAATVPPTTVVAPAAPRPAGGSRSFVPENIRPLPATTPSSGGALVPAPVPAVAPPVAPTVAPAPAAPALRPVVAEPVAPVAEEVPEDPAPASPASRPPAVTPAPFAPPAEPPRALEVPDDDEPVAGEVE